MFTTMQDALREIAIRAPSIGHEAMKALQANNSPVRQQRYNAIVMHALRDSEAQWTEDERRGLMTHYQETDTTRSEMLSPVRVTLAELELIQRGVAVEERTVSDYVRHAVLDYTRRLLEE